MCYTAHTYTKQVNRIAHVQEYVMFQVADLLGEDGAGDEGARDHGSGDDDSSDDDDAESSASSAEGGPGGMDDVFAAADAPPPPPPEWEGPESEGEDPEDPDLPIFDHVTCQVKDSKDPTIILGRIKAMHEEDVRKTQLTAYCRMHQCSKVRGVGG